MQQGDIETGIGISFLLRNWPPALQEWDMRSVRNASFASPQFPRLLNPNAIQDTIAKGVTESLIAYVSRPQNGEYLVFRYRESEPMDAKEIEISDEMCIITAQVAEEYVATRQQSPEAVTDQAGTTWEKISENTSEWQDNGWIRADEGKAGETYRSASMLRWLGEIPAQKWTMFYNKVLSRFAVGQNLKLTVQFEVQPSDGISEQKLEETKLSLRELGLHDEVDVT